MFLVNKDNEIPGFEYRICETDVRWYGIYATVFGDGRWYGVVYPEGGGRIRVTRRGQQTKNACIPQLMDLVHAQPTHFRCKENLTKFDQA